MSSSAEQADTPSKSTRSTPYADEPRIAAWNQRVDSALIVMAVVFLIGYAWLVLDTELTPAGRIALDILLTATWVLFGLDYLIRLHLAQHKWRFVGLHLPDLIMLILPMFRQLYVLRVITALSVLNRQIRDDIRGRVDVYMAGTVILVWFVASLAVLDAERNAEGANITTFGDAAWWTLVTISTVGYGDRYPVTLEGRLVAAALVIAGIALLGVVSGTIASWFMESLQLAGAQVAEQVAEDVEDMAEDVARTEVEMAAVLAPN